MKQRPAAANANVRKRPAHFDATLQAEGTAKRPAHAVHQTEVQQLKRPAAANANVRTRPAHFDATCQSVACVVVLGVRCRDGQNIVGNVS